MAGIYNFTYERNTAEDISDTKYVSNLSDGTNAYVIKDSNAIHSEDVTSTYSPTGTDPVNGTAVAGALATVLPSQTSQSGKFLTTNGTSASWATIPEELPSQSGQSGKFLTTNGTAVSWADTPSELPSQSGNNGKVLSTNGTAVSWISLPTVDQTYDGTSTNAQSGVAVASVVGDLTSLTTTTKTSAVAAINEVNSNKSKVTIRRFS